MLVYKLSRSCFVIINYLLTQMSPKYTTNAPPPYTTSAPYILMPPITLISPILLAPPPYILMPPTMTSNLAAQSLHANGFSPLCRRRCVFRFDVDENLL